MESAFVTVEATLILFSPLRRLISRRLFVRCGAPPTTVRVMRVNNQAEEVRSRSRSQYSMSILYDRRN